MRDCRFTRRKPYQLSKLLQRMESRALKRILSLMTTRGALLVLLALLLILPVSTRAEEDVLRLLIWEGYAPEKYVEDFESKIEAKYGKEVRIEVSFVGGSDDFYDPVRDKSVDVVSISHHLIKDERFKYITNELILPIDLKNIPNHVNVIPDLQNADYHVSNGKIYGVPIANGPYGLAFNSAMFEHEPQSWKVLWDPAFKNKYVLGAYEYLYNINITALMMGYPLDQINNYDALNNKEFRRKLRQLTMNAHSFWIGVDRANDLLGLSLAASWGDSFTSLREKGEVWKMATPDEGTMWWIDDFVLSWSLADKPFLKMVAEEWINETLSSDFQIENIVREIGTYPVVTNIESRLTDDEKSKVATNSSPGAFDNHRILQHTYSQRDRNGLKLMWDEAMEGITIERQKP